MKKPRPITLEELKAFIKGSSWDTDKLQLSSTPIGKSLILWGKNEGLLLGIFKYSKLFRRWRFKPFALSWSIEKFTRRMDELSRSRSRPAPGVGSDRGGPDDDGEIAEPKSSVGHELSPPRRDRPIPFPLVQGEACNPMLAVRRKRR